MKLKRTMILFAAVCMLNIMVTGCGSGAGSAVKTEEDQARERQVLEPDVTDMDSLQETDQEETADTKTNDMESSKPGITEENETDRQEVEEIEEKDIPQGDPIAGIVEAYDGNTITVRTPEDDMLYLFSAEDVPILEGYSTEDAHEVEGDLSIVAGDKVEVSYRGLLDDEKHPIEALKIVVIIVE